MAEAEAQEQAKPAKKSGKVVIIKKIMAGHGGHHGGSWKVAYADFVTAMMAFFLLMWLISTLNPEQKEEISIYFQEGGMAAVQAKDAQNKLALTKADKLGVPDVKLSRNEKLRYTMVLKIKEFIEADQEIKHSAEAMADTKGVIFYVDSDLLFEPKSANLKPKGTQIMNHVVSMLKEHNFDMVIRGHTDDVEQPSGPYPSNWELSAARAAACLRQIIKLGNIPATRLRAMGYADSRPLVPNSSPENRAKNRRVEFYYHRPDEQSW